MTRPEELRALAKNQPAPPPPPDPLRVMLLHALQEPLPGRDPYAGPCPTCGAPQYD